MSDPRETDAFAGLADETMDAILDTVTPEELADFVAVLTPAPKSVEQVRWTLIDRPWFPSNAKQDTQRRRLRILRDAAVAAGHPVCSTNAGYFLGTADDMRRSAERARRFAEGAVCRADRLDALATRLSRPPVGAA